jgi:hypothetical protein
MSFLAFPVDANPVYIHTSSAVKSKLGPVLSLRLLAPSHPWPQFVESSRLVQS